MQGMLVNHTAKEWQVIEAGVKITIPETGR